MSCSRVLVVATTLVAAFAVACGKKGDVQAPPSKLAAPITDLQGVQLGPEVSLRMTYPTATLGGLPLAGLDSLEVWKMDMPYFVYPPPEPLEDADADEDAEGAVEAAASDAVEPDADEPEADEAEADEPETDEPAADDEEDEEEETAEEIEVDPLPRIDALTFEAGAEMLFELRDVELNAKVVGGQIVLAFPLPEQTPLEELQEEEKEAEPEPEDDETEGDPDEPAYQPPPPVRKLMTVFGIRTRATGRKPGPFSNLVRIVFQPPPEAPTDVRVVATETALVVTWEADLPVVAAADGSSADAEEPAPEEDREAAVEQVEALPAAAGEPAGPIVNQPGVLVGFNVYRRLAAVRDFGPPIVQLRQPLLSFTDTRAEYASHYVYAVTAVAEGDTEVESARTEAAEIHYRDVFPPRAPVGLVALSEATRIRLLWDRVTSTDLDGYRIYRATGDAEAVALNDSLLVALDFSDESIEAGRTYTYTVTAVDTEGNESPPSEAATATTR